MRDLFLVLVLTCCVSSVAIAAAPVEIAQKSLLDITQIEDPTLLQTFYGKLTDFPHTYEIRATEGFRLRTEILIPDIEGSANNISGVIVREIKGTGSVEEVGVLDAKQATWESKYEHRGGDQYRVGPIFEGEVGPGVYRVEVHTPDNVEKYVLKVGTRENSEDIGYFETIRRVAAVKNFFEKSEWRIIESPYIYLPTVLLFVVLGILGFLVTRKFKKM